MNYVTEVADCFLALNPNSPILDPADYTTIAEWEKQQIPLAIVLASIKEARNGLTTQSPCMDSLTGFKEVVKTNFRNWLQYDLQM